MDRIPNIPGDPEWARFPPVPEIGLRGAVAKAHRAYKHLYQLGGLIHDGGENHAYGYVSEFHPNVVEDRGVCVLRMVLDDAPRIEWALLLGEAIHQLRSALDHLIWHLVIFRGGEPKDGLTGFPIATTEQWFQTKGLAMLAGLAPDDITKIKRLQPFDPSQGYPVDKHPLVLLNNLWNAEKHRFLTPIAFVPPASSAFLDNVKLIGRDCIVKRVWVNPRPPAEGQPLAAVSVVPTGPDPEVEMEGSLPVQIAFGQQLVSLAGIQLIGDCVNEIFFVLAEDASFGK